MTHTVHDWMSSPVVVIPPEMSATQALTLMCRRGIHSVVADLSRKDQPSPATTGARPLCLSPIS